MLTINQHAPPRGFFSGIFPAPLDTPDILVGLRGEIACRVDTLGTHNALYQVSAFGEALESAQTFDDGTQRAVMRFVAAPDSVQPAFMLSPALGRPVKMVPKVSANWATADLADGPSLEGGPVNVSSTRQVWSMTFEHEGLSVLLWAHVRANDPVVDFEWCALTGDRKGRMAVVRFDFGPGFAVCADGKIRDSGILDRTIDIGDAGISGPHHFRVVGLGMVDDVDADLGDGTTALINDLLADCVANAHLGPWFGKPAAWPGLWLGSETSHAARLAEFVAIPAPAAGGTDPRRWIPRDNPNAGGTDSSFGCSWIAQFADSDPRVVREMLTSCTAWGEHPIWYLEPGTLDPIAPPPSHPKLTTHKLQPWQGNLDGTAVPIPSKPKAPFDPQHRAFGLLLSSYGMTGSFALRYVLRLWIGSELHDRRPKSGWIGNGREEGRVAYNVVSAVELGIGDEPALDYLRKRMRLVAGKRLRAAGPIAPVAVSDRGVPWEAWTPWEEAQAAWGWWRLSQAMPNDTQALDECIASGRNVALALGNEGGAWWIPYRCQWIADGSVPDIKHPWSPGVFSPLCGPNSLFSWAALGLRAYLLASKRFAMPWDETHRKAAQALLDMDAAQRPHLCDAHMSALGTASKLAAEVLKAEPQPVAETVE